MAKLPDRESVYGSRPIPRANAPLVQVDLGAEARSQIKSGEALSSMGESAQKIGLDIQKKEKARQEEEDVFSIAAAKTQYIREMANLEQQISLDPDYMNHEATYKTKEAEIRKNAAQLVKTQRSSDLLNFSLEADAIRGLEKIRGNVQSKQIDAGRAYIAETVDTMKSMFPSLDSNQQKEAISNLMTMVKSASDPDLKTGRPAYLSKTDAEKMTQGLRDDFSLLWFKNQTLEDQIVIAQKRLGVPTLDSKAPLNQRNNNPGNLRDAEGQYRKFNTPQEGIKSMQDDLLVKISGRSKAMESRFGKGYTANLSNLITTWAPPSENDTQAYINFVSEKTGIDPLYPLSEDDINKIMPAMIEFEGGKGSAEYFSMSGPSKKTGTPADLIDEDKFQDIVKSAKNEMAAVELDKDPSKFYTDLDSGKYDQFYTQKEIIELKASAISKFEKIRETQKMDRLIYETQKNKEVFSAIYNNELSLADVNKLEASGELTPETASYAKSLILKSDEDFANKASIEDRISAQEAIWAELEIIADKKENGKVYFEDYARLQNKIMSLTSNNYLTKTEASSFLNKILPSMAEQAEAEPTDRRLFFGKNNPYYEANAAIREHLKGQENAPILKQRMMARYIELSDSVDALNLPAKQAAEEKRKLIQQAIDDVARADNPVLNLLAPGQTPNAVRKSDGTRYKVLPGDRKIPEAIEPKINYDIQVDEQGNAFRVFPD